MKAYLALHDQRLRLAFRDKQVMFFNYLFPLIFFFAFATMLHAERGGGIASMIVTDVLVIGILGNGFFGAGMRAVQERERTSCAATRWRRFRPCRSGRIADDRPAALLPAVS